MIERKKYLECGIIINTHGVRGNVKLESLCDSPEVLSDLSRVFVKEGNTYREIKVLHTSIFKSFVLADLEGINDMDTAAAMKGTTLYADREDFELEDKDITEIEKIEMELSGYGETDYLDMFENFSLEDLFSGDSDISNLLNGISLFTETVVYEP